MNYEDMSDFEIKHAVARIVLRARRDCEEIYCNQVTGECRWADGANWHNFDPLSNPSDAWPIIVANRINVYASEGPDFMPWMAGCGGFMVSNKNPLRAAMIVFLMMQEQAK